MKKIVSILVLCFFVLTIVTSGAAAKNNNSINMAKENPMKANAFGQQKKFNDIEFDWAKDEINKTAQKGFMRGYEDGRFQPNKPITCLETIVALMSTLEQEGAIDLEDIDAGDYDDLLDKIPEWGKVYVAAALQEGILLESEMDSFNPNQGIKRYQAAIYFARIADSEYAEYFEDIIDDVDEFDFNFDDTLDEIEAILEALDEIIEDYEDEETDEDEEQFLEKLTTFKDQLQELQDNVEELQEDFYDREILAEIIDMLDELNDQWEEIMEDEEYDEELDELSDEVKDLLQGMKPASLIQTYPEMARNLFRFFDEDMIPLYARNSVKIMQRLRIMFGDTDGKFSPMRVVKRNELAAMLNRLDDNYFGEKYCDWITCYLDDVDYDEEEETVTLYVVDKTGDAIDEFLFDDNDRLFYDGKAVEFDEDEDEDEITIEDIETGGKIIVCLNQQEEIIWAKIYAPDED